MKCGKKDVTEKTLSNAQKEWCGLEEGLKMVDECTLIEDKGQKKGWKFDILKTVTIAFSLSV